MRYISLLAALCICSFAHAQTGVKYAGSIDGGLLLASKTYDGFAFLSQGIAFKKYRLGISGGYDFYRLRSIPLFADAIKVLSHKKVQPFVQLGAGMNIASPTGGEKNRLNWYGEGSYKNGFFAKAGGGVILAAQKKVSVTFSAGFTYKSTAYKYKITGTDNWPYQTIPLKDDYHFKRWYLAAGIRW